MTANRPARPGRDPVTADGGAIADEAERRAAAARQYNLIEQEVINHRGWFARLLPPPDRGGLGAEAFTIQLLSQLQRNRKLMEAALVNPQSLLYAATDCAARNLVPGEEYWFVPFKSKDGPPTVTGMPGWKGEQQQIYRSGMVESVVCELVYEGDHFKWLPTRMQVPEHEPADVSHDPVNLRRVYGFCRLRGGGVTHPVVLGTYEIAQAEAHSRAPEDFWRNTRWRGRMWLKTCLHYMYDRVPHSAAYNTQLVEAFAIAAQRFPALSAAGSDDGSDLTAGPDHAPGVQVPAAVRGQAVRPAPPALPANGRSASPPSQDPPAGDGDAVGKSAAGRIGYLFGKYGWSGDQHRDRRLAVTGILAAPPGRPPLAITSTSDLTAGQARQVIDYLLQLEAKAGERGEPVSDSLQRLYDQMQAGREGAGDGTQVPAG